MEENSMKKRKGLLFATLLVALTATFAGCDLLFGEKEPQGEINPPPSNSSTVEKYTLKFAGLPIDQIVATVGEPIGELPNVPARVGYTAVGWEIDGTPITAETIWTFTETKSANPVYKANEDTPYTIEVWGEGLDGQFTKQDIGEAGNMEGTTATMVSIPETMKNPTDASYEFDSTNENNVLEGKVAADGSLVLKVYYKLKKHFVK